MLAKRFMATLLDGTQRLLRVARRRRTMRSGCQAACACLRAYAFRTDTSSPNTTTLDR
jgi:hypothetical protein